MNESLELLSVPLITSLVYLAMYVYKIFVGSNEKLKRLTPAFAVILGFALGIVAFYGLESLAIAPNVLSAALVGGASGLAATGTHQVYKQIFCDKDNSNIAEKMSGLSVDESVYLEDELSIQITDEKDKK